MLIVAGGKGTRVNSEVPKQFIELNHRPVLMHTIESLLNNYQIDQIVLVLPSRFVGYWEELCKKHHFNMALKISEGGPKRYHSVKRGLSLIPNNVLVAIHDSVRPFVSRQLLKNGFEIAARKGNAVPVVAINESIREISGSLNKAANRNQFKVVQTPQFFQASLIKKAYQRPFNDRFTDDATILESSGQQIYLFDGEPSNIKITTPEDLILAESLLAKNKLT